MQKILVVEDDWELNQSICYVLEKEGYSVHASHTIKEAKEMYLFDNIQLILLDINLPDGEGYIFCEWVKRRQNIPVLFLTARDLEQDALKGYEMGADDYVTKPFSMKILIKKINVILKRVTGKQKLYWNDGYLKVDTENAKVQIDGEICSVTPTEFRLLKEFLKYKGQLLTYEILLESLWDGGGQFVDRHTLAVNINRLRGKIENNHHKYISNVYGMGYQWLT